jgi:hypothetical protein
MSAKENPLRLVLPEGTEPRSLQAARRILNRSWAVPVTLVGSPGEIERTACSVDCGQAIPPRSTFWKRRSAVTKCSGPSLGNSKRNPLAKPAAKLLEAPAYQITWTG